MARSQKQITANVVIRTNHLTRNDDIIINMNVVIFTQTLDTILRQVLQMVDHSLDKLGLRGGIKNNVMSWCAGVSTGMIWCCNSDNSLHGGWV